MTNGLVQHITAEESSSIQMAKFASDKSMSWPPFNMIYLAIKQGIPPLKITPKSAMCNSAINNPKLDLPCKTNQNFWNCVDIYLIIYVNLCIKVQVFEVFTMFVAYLSSINFTIWLQIILFLLIVVLSVHNTASHIAPS